MSPEDVVAVQKLLSDWQIPEGREQMVHDMARASLDEVKGLTEYEDGKVGRLLIIVAFLTAMAGAVFSRFSATFPLPRMHELANDSAYFWPLLTYSLFTAYAVLVAVSAYVVFGAIKPTFNEPKQWKARSDGPPKSMNFYARILDANPQVWAQTFVGLTGGKGGPDALQAQYAKDYIFESYLVAEKVAHKLKKVAPAVRWLQWSMLVLAAFIGAYLITLIVLPAPV